MAFVVVYDACVLYPAPLRDLLIRLAESELVRARWTDEILDECYENVLRVLSDRNDEVHADMRRWVGRAYDPEKFELEKVNEKLGVICRRLERMRRASWRREGVDRGAIRARRPSRRFSSVPFVGRIPGNEVRARIQPAVE